MALGKKYGNYVKSIAELKEMDYSKIPQLQDIYTRLQKGRGQFEEVMKNNLQAVMQISSLDVVLEKEVADMEGLSSRVAESSQYIHQAAGQTTTVAGEVAKAHEGLTSTIVEVSGETDTVYNKNKDGQQQLTEIRNLSSTTIEESKNMEKDMNELLDVIEHMNEVISGITAISDQTNLLALNASIEAARAGEAGRGFAVVAEEIRQLAEQTKQLTGNMGEFVEGIRGASQKSSNSVSSTIEALGNISDKINLVWQMNEENQESLGKITDAISSLAAVSEEISSSTDELENQAARIEEQCDELKTDAAKMNDITEHLNDAVTPLAEVEQTMDGVAKTMGQMSQDVFYMLDNKAFLEYVERAIEAHKSWMENLRSMVNDKEIRPIQTDSAKCAFGHFYYAFEPQNEEIKPIWDGLEAKHKKFHEYGKRTAKALFEEDYNEAEKICREAENYSGEVLADLQKIVELIKKINQENKRI